MSFYLWLFGKHLNHSSQKRIFDILFINVLLGAVALFDDVVEYFFEQFESTVKDLEDGLTLQQAKDHFNVDEYNSFAILYLILYPSQLY